MIRIFFFVLILCTSLITYTQTDPQTQTLFSVQVAALSDADNILALRSQLAKQGYPAYIESSPDAEGALFRLRVGLFLNREPAVMLAESMPQTVRTSPTPALVEVAPPTFATLIPELIATYPHYEGFTTLKLVAWPQDRVALRYQGHFERQWFEAEYRILDPLLVRSPFRAWRATEDSEGALIRVHNTLLWPDNFDQYTEDELVKAMTVKLAEVATELELSTDQLTPYIMYTPGSGQPFIVKVERFDWYTGQTEIYPMIGEQPTFQMPDYGPSLTWFDRGFAEDLPEEPQIIMDVSAQLSLDTPLTDSVFDGDGWRAEADGTFTRIGYTNAQGKVAGRLWRTLAGTPVWAQGDHLLLIHNDAFLLYRLMPFQQQAPSSP